MDNYDLTLLAIGIIASGYDYLLGYRELLKSNYDILSKETKDKISKEGILHFTSKENAEKILDSGYLIPSKGLMANHFAKSRYGDKFANFVYAYAGKPTFNNYRLNFTGKASKDGTLYAVRYYPDKNDLENFTERPLDGALLYEGKLHLSNASIVRFKIKDNELERISLDEDVQKKAKGPQKILQSIKIRKNRTNNLTSESIGIDPKSLIKIFRNPLNRVKLQRCIARRKYDNALLAQINENYSKMISEKDGVNYNILPLGAKIDGGKLLSGFKVENENGDFQKNIFIDLTDRSKITDADLSKFILQYSNMDTERSEYIGKPFFKNGDLHCEIDDTYKKYFNRRQIMLETSGEIPNQKSDKLITNQLKKLADNYSRSTTKGRKAVFNFLRSIIKDERGSIRIDRKEGTRDDR